MWELHPRLYRGPAVIQTLPNNTYTYIRNQRPPVPPPHLALKCTRAGIRRVGSTESPHCCCLREFWRFEQCGMDLSEP